MAKIQPSDLEDAGCTVLGALGGADAVAPPEQKTRIESAEFYELLQREVARRFPQHSAR